MAAELGRWNAGAGIDLDGWRSGMGNFSLACAYADLFCPQFEIFEDYILPKGVGAEIVRRFERQPGATPFSVEYVLSHVHLADLQGFADDLTADKLLFIGERFAEIVAAKLASTFPERPCHVEFFRPDDPLHLDDYQVWFCQKKHLPTQGG
jgi:hypothetical protein